MTTLSNRQYPMLKAFIDLPHDSYMPVEAAQQFDQRPFRSMLIRKYVSYRPGKGFYLTKEGREHWREFGATEIFRKNASDPLTAYFDPASYGLRAEKRLHKVA
jgi:hypothetical protein